MGINGGRGIVGSGSVLGGSGISIAGGGEAPFSFGNALQFDGVNDFATSASTKVITGKYSIFFYLKIPSRNDVWFNYSDTNNYLLYMTSNLWYWHGFSGRESFSYITPLNTWLAITISRNESNICTLYVNGMEIDTCTRVNNFSFYGIGGYGSFTTEGLIDELYIYDGVEADLNDNIAFYNSGNGIDLRTRAGFETPDRYYSFNEENDATIVTDAGTDGSDLTLTNFSTPPAYFVPH